jgi:hypothetical protein
LYALIAQEKKKGTKKKPYFSLLISKVGAPGKNSLC